MKSFLTALLLLPLASNGQEAECPKTHGGAALTNASAMFGQRGEEIAESHGGPEKPVTGGVTTEMPATTRWLVCWYGKDRSDAVWIPLNHDPYQVRSCIMTIRGKKARTISMVCK